MSVLERGFKSWAERLSEGVRRDLGIPPAGVLRPDRLAAYLAVELLTPHDIPGIPPEVLDQLLEKDPWGWSATTQIVGKRTIVIINPRHSAGRRASNVMHEMAHLLLDHEPSKIMLLHDGSLVMRTFDQRQEDEANWLSGCLLLPRVALLRVVRERKNAEEIAAAFGVSEVLVNYRVRITGVAAQAKSASRSRRAG